MGVMVQGKKITRRKNKGFTIIELMMVLSILSIITLIVSPNVKVYSDKKAEIELEYAMDGIIEIINIGKSYARLNEQPVQVKFTNDKVELYQRSTEIKEFKMPRSINRIDLSSTSKSIEINGFGQIGSAQSINIYNRNGGNKTITIKVATAYVSEKKTGE